MIKKVVSIILCLSFILTIVPIKVEGQTLREYKNELAELQKQKVESDRMSTELRNKINQKRNAITAANNTIEENEEKVEEAKQKVVESQAKIKVKTEELKETFKNLQYSRSQSESIYIDYVFEASSISEMIEREAVIEQITENTQKNLESLEKLVDDNEKLQVKLADDNEKLESSISQYEQQVKEFDEYLDKQVSIGLNKADEIKIKQNMVKIYEDAECKDNEEIDDCYTNKMVTSSSFSRPLKSGRVTQAWNASHGAMDLGGNPKGTPIYAPASGTVIYTKTKYHCGGNIIYMQHIVGGKKYTTEYAHLTAIKVQVGQTVLKGQIIGTVGGDPSTYYYDSCTRGVHLHYAIANGHWFTNKTYNDINKFKSNSKPTSNYSISGLKSVAGWKWSTLG